MFFMSLFLFPRQRVVLRVTAFLAKTISPTRRELASKEKAAKKGWDPAKRDHKFYGWHGED